MKLKKIRMQTILLLLLPLCVILLAMGCKDDNEYSDQVEGYIVGSFIADEFNTKGEATGNKTERGYCILLEGSENNAMNFYSFNIPEGLFSFPDEILTPDYNGDNCGPSFFPDSLKYAYKISFKYQIVSTQDEVPFVTGACRAMLASFPWENYDQVMVTETSKSEP
ncbi:hypothetical protein [Maribellus luteus]|nr:hypothetical protein [Maribellus luteus]